MARSEAEHAPTAIRVDGQPYGALPQDLYIPPDALRVFLETFEGPLDLLLYLIRRQNLDILDIPVFTITQQYLAYIEMMEDMAIELAGEYLLMAAMLAEIKSRMLLPKSEHSDEEEGEDPRAELVRRLAEYEQFKEAAERLDDWPRVGRDLAPIRNPAVGVHIEKPAPKADLRQLLAAMSDVLSRAEHNSEHVVTREALSVREHLARILEGLGERKTTHFTAMIVADEGRPGVVVTFLAVLELAREALLVVQQDVPYGPLSLRRRGEA